MRKKLVAIDDSGYIVVHPYLIDQWFIYQPNNSIAEYLEGDNS